MMVALAGFEADAGQWIRMVGSRVPSYVRLLQELLALMADPEKGGPIRRRLEAPWAGRRFEATYERPCSCWRRCGPRRWKRASPTRSGRR